MNQDQLSPDEEVVRRGIFLLPNLLTTLGLLMGFFAIISVLQDEYIVASIAILLGMLADGLDGRVARLTGTESEFGAQYDSLADMVTFGVAPALLVYNWALAPYGKIGWLIAFLYMTCVALRLARFNVRSSNMDKQFFLGLPSPPPAALLASMVWAVEEGFPIALWLRPYMLAIVVALAILMISNVTYDSFKTADLKKRVPFANIILSVLILMAIAIEPAITLFLMALVYVVTGPIVSLIRSFKK